MQEAGWEPHLGSGVNGKGEREHVRQEAMRETWGQVQKMKRGQAGLAWKGRERKEASNQAAGCLGLELCCLSGYRVSVWFSPFLFQGSGSRVINNFSPKQYSKNPDSTVEL